MFLLLWAGCGGDPFEAMLAEGAPADVSAWGVTVGDRNRYEKRKQVGYLSTDPALPHLRLETYNDSRTTFVRGIDLVLPVAGNVEALREAWGEPHGIGSHPARPDRDENGRDVWTVGETRTETWWSADRTQVATLWTTDDDSWAPRVTVRTHRAPETVLEELASCRVFGIGLGDRTRELEGVDNIDGGRLRAPSVTPVDLDPLVAFSDPKYLGKADGMLWSVRDDGSFLGAARTALSALESLGTDRWACGDDAQVELIVADPQTVQVALGPRAAAEPSEPRWTPEEQQVVDLAQAQAFTTSCLTTESVWIRLEFSVADGRVARMQVYDIPRSFNNAAPSSNVRSDDLARCLRDEAKSWTFPEELTAADLEVTFGSRPF